MVAVHRTILGSSKLEAFYFGPSESYLFGSYHPREGGSQNEGVILCNPFGQEYLRAHKSIRRLAINLASQGYSVLRFDYRGTGDSAGDLHGVTTDHWANDISHAIQELIDMAAVPKVAVIGLRLGALVAAKAVVNDPRISRLVLWDPVLDGESYIDDLVDTAKKSQSQGSRSRIIEPDGTLHFNGFSMPECFQYSVSQLKLASFLNQTKIPIAQIVSHETEGFSQLEAQLSNRVGGYHELAPAPHDWNYVDHVGGILWPKPVIDAIERYFSQPTL